MNKYKTFKTSEPELLDKFFGEQQRDFEIVKIIFEQGYGYSDYGGDGCNSSGFIWVIIRFVEPIIP